tara:strand:+ start:1017 stop:2426 length:1410 start_codon:yes stop_codon:yes gene_type:complete
MADYVPSSTGQGQGSAQVLEGSFTPVNMDETVKAIDNVAAEQKRQAAEARKQETLENKKEYLKQVEAQKKRQESIDKINDLANANTGVQAFDDANKIILEGFTDRMNNGTENFEDIYNDAMSLFNQNTYQRENAQDAAQRLIDDRNSYQSFVYDEEWTDNSTPALNNFQKQYNGLDKEEFTKLVLSGEWGAISNSAIANTTNNPNFSYEDPELTIFNSYKKIKDALEVQQSIDKTGEAGGQNIYTSSEISSNRRLLNETLLNNPQLRQQELYRYARNKGVNTDLSPENKADFENKYKQDINNIVYGDVKTKVSTKSKQEKKKEEEEEYFNLGVITDSSSETTPRQISIDKIDDKTKDTGSDVIFLSPKGKGDKTATIDIKIGGETLPKEVTVVKYIRQSNGRSSVDVIYKDVLSETNKVRIPYTEEIEAIFKNSFGEQLDRKKLNKYLESKKEATKKDIETPTTTEEAR